MNTINKNFRLLNWRMLVLIASITLCNNVFALRNEQCASLDVAQWIEGSWKAEQKNRLIIERWHKSDQLTFTGIGTTQDLSAQSKGEESISFVEDLRLVEMGGRVFYLAKTPQNALPVAFELVECTQDQLKFQNLTHDFPQVLNYRKLENGHMQVVVSDAAGKGFELDFARQIENNNVQKVRLFVEAYNTKDLQKMLALASDDIQWMSINNDQLKLETNGKKTLEDEMRQHFSSETQGHSELINPVELGSRIFAIEKAIWKSTSGIKTQCSAVAYQFDRELIQRVWYFPAETCK